MNIEIENGALCGTIVAPPSKSYAHRQIIAATLSGGHHVIKNAGESDDVKATVGALRSLGADITLENGTVTVNGFTPVESAVVDCKESGSTLRFLFPIAAALGIKATFTGEGKLLYRPIGALIDTLNEHGAEITDFTVNGKISNGCYKVDSGVSSQFLTGLMFALPLLDGQSSILPSGMTVSAHYTEMTTDVLLKSGMDIGRKNGAWIFSKNARYNFPEYSEVEGDWSGAAVMLAAAAIGGDVKVKGLNPRSLQGDAAIMDILGAFGAETHVAQDFVRVKSSRLYGVTIDCENIPDLVQILSVIAAFANGKTILKNVGRLRYKESDRIEAVIKTLRAANVYCECDGNVLTVFGGGASAGVFESGNDHRTVMAASVLAAYSQGKSTIIGADAVQKSYPSFFDDLKALKGVFNVGV